MQKPPPLEVGIMNPLNQPKPPKPTLNPVVATVALVVMTGMVCATILGVVWMVTR